MDNGFYRICKAIENLMNYCLPQNSTGKSNINVCDITIAEQPILFCVILSMLLWFIFVMQFYIYKLKQMPMPSVNDFKRD